MIFKAIGLHESIKITQGRRLWGLLTFRSQLAKEELARESVMSLKSQKEITSRKV